MEKKRSAEQILRDRYKKQNDYNREKYERITVLAPPGTVEKIKALGVKSVSKFALQLLTAEITRRERSADQETSAENVTETPKDQEPKTETEEPTQTPETTEPAPKQEAPKPQAVDFIPPMYKETEEQRRAREQAEINFYSRFRDY